jgi:stalled ribosome alternative rescue factor ArfA
MTKKTKEETKKFVKNNELEATLRATIFTQTMIKMIKLGIVREAKTNVKGGKRYIRFSKNSFIEVVSTAIMAERAMEEKLLD